MFLSIHGRPAFGPSCTHFDNDATSKIDDVLTEYVGLLHVLPLAVHLNFDRQVRGGDHDILVPAPVPLGLIWVLNWVGLGWGWA